MSRTPLIVGNWKMNLDHLEAIRNVQELAFRLPKDYYEFVDVAVTVPFTDLRSVQTLVEGDKLSITYGAQDVSEHPNGAHTGDISAPMLAKLGCTWVVVGHSERRDGHAESNEQVAAKAQAALKADITPIVCVGESLEVRESGEHVSFVTNQVRDSLAGLSAADIAKTVIAYEPVWAIGTGKVASPGDAQEVCAAIRETISTLTDDATAAEMRLLYGGSIKSDTIADLVSRPDIDGGLVGGASLEAQDFAKLAANAASAGRAAG